MSIRNWIDWLKRLWSQEESDPIIGFIDPEPSATSHSDPEIRAILSELASTKRKINWASWKIYQPEQKPELSEFEKYQLSRLPKEFEKLVKLYRAQEALLRGHHYGPRKGTSPISGSNILRF